jgi:hypothetical protein
MTNAIPAQALSEFKSKYDASAMDQLWNIQSQKFRSFWADRVIPKSSDAISDVESDEVIRILDRNGKGNTKDSEAVAKAMVPQGAWRRMFNEFHTNEKLGSLITDLLKEDDPKRKAALIDELYKMNAGQGNNLTGPSGNAISAFLAAFDPSKNLSIISLKDRRAVIEFLGLSVPFDWDTSSIGTRIVTTNALILEAFRSSGLEGSARTISCFCYFPSMKALWKGEHTVLRTDKSVSVSIPTATDIAEETEGVTEDSIRESMQMQALICKIGTSMGCTIWLPKADRGRVLKAWKPEPGELLETLPLGFDSSTMKTVEQIDVLWLKKRTIVRAFEVEHTTSVYSGLLRMADLVALQPNINIKLHIVAPTAKRDKVMQEIMRPVFSLLEGRALSEICTYLSYDTIKEIGDLKHLSHLSDKVIDDYEEFAQD